jgi:hypothetical protein
VDLVAELGTSYADDVTLLAPCVEAVRRMLSVCEAFARDFSATFNAEKSVLLVLGSDRYTNTTFKLNGAVIKHEDRAKHLGAYVGRDCTTYNVRDACASLYSKSNVIMSRFGHCDVEVRSYLFESQCTSFYGCPLWDMNEYNKVITAWKKMS